MLELPSAIRARIASDPALLAVSVAPFYAGVFQPTWSAVGGKLNNELW